MPRGFQGVKQTSEEIQARRNAGGDGGTSALWFRLADGESAIVRFLEQGEDIFWCYMHEVPVEGRNFGRDVVCCNQENDGTPCPGCEQDLQRKFKGFVNLIWNEAPIFKRDKEGKLEKEDGKVVITGHKPQVAVWGSGIRVFEELEEVNTDYRGLRSRRFKVKRKGVKLDTKYHISPADTDGGKEDFTAAEKELEAKKYDLNTFIKPPSYDEFLKELGQSPQQHNGGGSGEQQGRGNPFMRNRG